MSEAPMDGTPFLVWLEEPTRGHVHTAVFHPNVKIIGNLFHFDCPKPIACMPMPLGPNGEPTTAPVREKRT